MCCVFLSSSVVQSKNILYLIKTDETFLNDSVDALDAQIETNSHEEEDVAEAVSLGKAFLDKNKILIQQLM